MPGDYQKVRLLNEDDNKETSDDLKFTLVSPNHLSLNKRILIVLFVLIFFNMILTAANAYYSVRMSQLLKQYEEKDLASLPHIDPFDGTYRPAGEPSCANSQESHFSFFLLNTGAY